MSGEIALILLILHAILFLFSLRVGGRPQSLVFLSITGINADVANPLTTISTAIAFMHQASTMWMSQGPSVLSKTTLVLQVATFLALAVSWPFRLVLPENLWHLGEQPALLMEWYPWVGWACVNNAVVAIGQATVLYVALRLDGRSTQSASERQVLLAT